MTKQVEYHVATNLGNGLGPLHDITNVTLHIEGGFGQVIVLALKDLLEGTDRVGKRNETALVTSEDLGNSERLGQETLNLTGTFDGELMKLVEECGIR